MGVSDLINYRSETENVQCYISGHFKQVHSLLLSKESFTPVSSDQFESSLLLQTLTLYYVFSVELGGVPFVLSIISARLGDTVSYYGPSNRFLI